MYPATSTLNSLRAIPNLPRQNKARVLTRPGLAVAFLVSFLTFASQSSAAQESVLYSFTGGSDGGFPLSDLIQDKSGNLYGTTGGNGGGTAGVGTVFKLSPEGVETVLHTFTNGPDGAVPGFGLLLDAQGNLYGTTTQGGSANSFFGAGTVFEITSDGTHKILHTFTGGADGGVPGWWATLIQDPEGNLYGTTAGGGSFGAGTVFEMAPSGEEKILYSFTGGKLGKQPMGALVRDAEGNLYGTTAYGGRFSYGGPLACHGGCGVVFELTADGKYKVLHTFTGRTDGRYPFTGLTQGADGVLYGTTSVPAFNGECDPGCGTIFKITKTGGYQLLHRFHGTDGISPSRLIQDRRGNLYGTTYKGGPEGSEGVVFELSPVGKITLIYRFTGGSEFPDGLARDAMGNLYGTIYFGGSAGFGAVFRLAP